MEDNELNIPKSFSLFSSQIKIVFDEVKMNGKQRYGEFNCSTKTISLSKTDCGDPLSNDRIKDTYYHEKVHAILDAMNEQDLNNNEKFVDLFAKLLRQSEETALYEDYSK